MALNEVRLKQQDYIHNTFALVFAPTESFEETLVPAYWAHVSKRLKPLDHILVTAADGSWIGELLVHETSDNWTKVSVIYFTKLVPGLMPADAVPPAADKIASATAGAFYREWNAKEGKHSVVRRADREVVSSHKSRGDADAEVDQLNQGSLV